jgi:membrane protein YdbS with pleckstrin-like domain
MPYETLFPGQEPNEKIILIVRKHWWIIFKLFLVYFILALIPLVLNGLMQSYTSLLAGGILTIMLKLLASIYYFFILTLFFRSWIDYYLDLGIITNERIVDIEQKGLFARSISEQKLYRVQDVSAEVKGFLPTLFHYGDIHIQTAGQQPHFIFDRAPHPYETTRKILDLVKFKKQKLLELGINPDLAEME